MTSELATTPASGRAGAALAAVHAARDAWADAGAPLRRRLLLRVAELLAERKADVLAAPRNGSAAADGDSGEGARDFEAALGMLATLSQLTGAGLERGSAAFTPEALEITYARPFGVTAVVAPASPTLAGLIATLGAPLAAGNTVVAVLPLAHKTLATTLLQSIELAAFPSGAFSSLFGDRIALAAELCADRRTDAVFAADLDDDEAERLAAACATRLVPLVWEAPRSVAAWCDGPDLEARVERCLARYSLVHPAVI